MLGDTLRWLSLACLGVFLGAQLTEGVVLVPYWQGLAAAEFFAWYKANDQRLLGFFGPLTTVTVGLALAAAAISLWQHHARKWWASTTGVLSIVILSMFFVYFEHANESFSAASISADALPAELARWSRWHWARVIMAAIAFAAAIVAARD